MFYVAFTLNSIYFRFWYHKASFFSLFLFFGGLFIVKVRPPRQSDFSDKFINQQINYIRGFVKARDFDKATELSLMLMSTVKSLDDGTFNKNAVSMPLNILLLLLLFSFFFSNRDPSWIKQRRQEYIALKMPFSYVDPWPLIIFHATVTAFIMNLYTKLEGMLLKVEQWTGNVEQRTRITSQPLYFRNVDFEYSPRNTFRSDLAYRQYRNESE